MKKIFGIAALLASLFACTEPVNPEPERETNGETTYTCMLPVVEFGKTAWEPGDKILFHGGSADNQKIITLKQEDIVDDTLCTVDLSGLKPYKSPTSNVKYFAAYPAELVKNEGQCKDMNTFTKANTLLMMRHRMFPMASWVQLQRAITGDGLPHLLILKIISLG